MEVIRLGHAHTCGDETIQGLHLGILPGFFLRFAAIAGTFFHGSRATAVFYFAAFGVIHALAETALVGLFINLRAAYLFSAAHYIDRGFLTTHQLADNLIDKPILDQRFNS